MDKQLLEQRIDLWKLFQVNKGNTTDEFINNLIERIEELEDEVYDLKRKDY